jgi:hypothetical protein
MSHMIELPRRNPETVERMRQTLDLYETAKVMMRQNLVRRFPQAGAEEIEDRLWAWLQKRDYDPDPGATPHAES